MPLVVVRSIPSILCSYVNPTRQMQIVRSPIYPIPSWLQDNEGVTKYH